MSDHISISSAEETPEGDEMEESMILDIIPPSGLPGFATPPGLSMLPPARQQLFIDWFGPPNDPDTKYPTCSTTQMLANQWYDKCMRETGYTEAILIPGKYGDTDGCFAVLSSEESCRWYTENGYRLMEQQFIDHPHWLAMTVYWIPQMTTANIQGLSSPHARRIGCLFDVVDDIFQRRQKAQWKYQYCYITPTFPRDYIHKDELRNMIWAAFDTNYIVEYVSSLAWQEFRSLQVYTRVSTADTEIPVDESRHIVYDAVDPWSRDDKNSSEWWKYDQALKTFSIQPINEWMQERMPYPHAVLPAHSLGP